MKNPIKNQRSRFLIDRGFQLRFAFYLLAPVALLELVFWIATELFVRQMIQKGVEQGLPAQHSFFALLAYQKHVLNAIVLGSGALVAVVLFAWGILISHRIAGPLVKFQNYLQSRESLAEASSQPLAFRSNDFFRPLAQAFNEFVKRAK